MLNSKQRAKLRSLAQTEAPVTQLGKSGVNDAFIDGLNKAIEKRQLIKITVLENSGYEPKTVGLEIAEKLSAEFVCATGRKLVFYRRNEKSAINLLAD